MDERIFNRRQVLGAAGIGIAGLSMSGQAIADPSDPNEQYLQLVSQQRKLRDSNDPNMDEEAIRSVLREKQDEFDGSLVFFGANDFGQPRVFLPRDLSDHDAALQAILDRVHERKWRARNSDLRAVRNQLFDDVSGIHQGLGALYHSDGSAAYDIDYPQNESYNFLTIRQVAGLIDWVANAEKPWLDGLQLTY